jgi:hypothetical protein
MGKVVQVSEHISVDLVVFAADFMMEEDFFDGFSLDCCAVFVGAADV